jgi:hypothetical protein
MIREGAGVIVYKNERLASEGPPRVHHENANPNQKIKREASVHVQ